VLFSEPKIPQLGGGFRAIESLLLVSVLFSEPKIPQRCVDLAIVEYAPEFQCSSASRKFLNRNARSHLPRVPEFQCSSASRKFLNVSPVRQRMGRTIKFQCSSASRKFLNLPIRFGGAGGRAVSVLFSEPKIPQLVEGVVGQKISTNVSVLFSEPKIPQRFGNSGRYQIRRAFQCSSASRKFLNSSRAPAAPTVRLSFQCSSASRKFLNSCGI